jgi:hypothetical protein
MERSHRLFVRSQSRSGYLGAGIYAHLDFRRGGSSLFPAPERPEIRTSFSIGTTSFVAPFAEVYITDNHKFKLSAYLEKFINREQNDFSFKTFNISNDYDEPFSSFSLDQESIWNQIDLKTRFEFFRWTYIYNDFWEGYTATGGAGEIEWTTPEFAYFPSLVLGTRVSMADRGYSSDIIKSGPCKGGYTPANPPVSTCRRVESLLGGHAFVSYVNKTKTSAFTFLLDYNDRKNDTLTVYDENSMSYFFTFTQAFPSLGQGAFLLETPRGMYRSRPSY